jgi:hypothetical protein
MASPRMLEREDETVLLPSLVEKEERRVLGEKE